jgi:hypothetical protein
MCVSVQKTKRLRSPAARPIRAHMGDIITNRALYTPHWKRLCKAAILEADPAKLLQRIAVAQSAVLDQIKDGFAKPSDGQQLALRDALHMLRTLRELPERDLGKQKRTVQSSSLEPIHYVP